MPKETLRSVGGHEPLEISWGKEEMKNVCAWNIKTCVTKTCLLYMNLQSKRILTGLSISCFD